MLLREEALWLHDPSLTLLTHSFLKECRHISLPEVYCPLSLSNNERYQEVFCVEQLPAEHVASVDC